MNMPSDKNRGAGSPGCADPDGSTNPEPPAFTERDPSRAAFWDQRFAERFTPWDQRGVPQAFIDFALALAPQPVLIPGCGSAHEARWLAERGFTVDAFDFSSEAVAAAREQLGPQWEGIVREADFFAFEPRVAPQWVYERAFLCALPPAMWPAYASRMAQLVPPGALLAGFFFVGATPNGPPFGMERNALDALLTPYFEIIDEHAVSESLPVFAQRERWLTWRRCP
jgi:SAM-dependent methyltransferase